jgi:integrase
MGLVTNVERRGSVYYFRRRVPLDLQAVIGRAVIKESLNERDPTRARQKHAERAAWWEARFASLRRALSAESGPARTELSAAEIDRFATEYRATLLEADEQIRLRGLGGRENGLPDDQFERHGYMIERIEEFARKDLARGRALSATNRAAIDHFLEVRGVKLDSSTEAYRRLAVEFLTTVVEAAADMRRRQSGEVLRTPPSAQDSQPAAAERPHDVTLETLIEGWRQDRQPREKTVYVFSKHVKVFVDFVPGGLPGVTADDAFRWKVELLKTQSAKTAFNHLASCKAVFGWAEENHLIPANPFAKVKLPKLKKKAKPRDYTEAEVELILEAARKLEGWRRWLPWLLHFTGARISEICQLSSADCGCSGGIWWLEITDMGDEDGEDDQAVKALKNPGSKRRVPVHQALIDEGFLSFVKSKRGLLFAEITPDRFGVRGGNASKTFSRWVRDVLGITDPRIAPAHSFRHLFKTLCRNAGITQETHDALTGHVVAGEGAEYGEKVGIQKRAEAIALIPVPPLLRLKRDAQPEYGEAPQAELGFRKQPDHAPHDPEPISQEGVLTAPERSSSDRVSSALVFSNRKHVSKPISAADHSDKAKARIAAILK